MKIEAPIQKSILEWLEWQRIFCRRINVQGVPLSNGKYRPAPNKGMSDIIASPIIQGYSVALWIEVKAPKGKQTPSQKIYQGDVEKFNGNYIIARSIDDVQNKLKEMGWEK